MRRYAGPVRIQGENGGPPRQIGEIEVWYIDGSVDTSIVEEPFYNDVLVIHALALTTDFRGLGLEARIIRKIADTLGYHCAAIVFDSDRLGITADHELELIPTKSSSLSALTDF